MSLSNAHEAVTYRLGAALDARHKAGHEFSLPLADEQWKIKAAEMFKTSVAALQLGFHDFAHGTYARTPGYARVAEAQTACRSIKIKSIDWKNIDAVLFWGILVLCILVDLFSRRHESYRRTRKKRDDGAKDDQYDGQL